MSNILEKNLQLLEKHQPHVFQKLSAYLAGSYEPCNTRVERILMANKGDLIINMLVVCGGNEHLICDHENPINESYSWIDKYIDPSNKAEIVFGMGMGFHLEVLLTSFKEKKVLVVEPNIELFNQILKVRNLELIIKRSELFVDERMDNIIDRIHSLFWDTGRGGIQCQPFEVYVEMFGDQWDELKSKFIKHAESFNVDIATRRHFGELWIYNNIMNARKLEAAANADGLAGKFKGVPGILVSAGPSLSKNVDLLKDLKDKCVIMAAGTAVNILENNGVTPHFMVGIDASEGEAKIHRNVKSKDIYFIYSNQVATGSVESYTGPKFLMNFTIDEYTNGFFEHSGIKSNMYLSGPSVANTCFDILFKMGCDPIILVGQDLAYTNGVNYAGQIPGSALKSEEEMKKDGFILRKDIYGRDVHTTLSYIAMKNWFEGYFEKAKDIIDIINATEGGLNIEHAQDERLEEVIGRYSFSSQNIEQSIREIYESSKFHGDIESKAENYKQYVLGEIAKLEDSSRKQLKLLDLIERDVYHPARDKKAFEKAAARINELTDKVIASPIYGSILKNMIEIEFFLIKMEVERATSEMNSYKDAKVFYLDAVKQQNRMLKEKLDKVKEILA